ncbi:MAG TPA: hypothetical protein VFG73_02050 [Rhodanobacteraceae bacterium]|nr:hypothetical protein [Rhodanobacteraceae bacterium]
MFSRSVSIRLALWLGSALLCAGARAQPPPGLDYSLDIPAQLGELTLAPADALHDDFALPEQLRRVVPSGLRSLQGPNLIALATAVNGAGSEQRWFAFDVWVQLPSGARVRPGQPFRCLDDACDNSDLFALPRLPQGTVLDAFAIDPATGDALFSLDSDAAIDGMVFRPSDVVRYAGDTYSLALGGAALPAAGLDAIDLLDDGRWLLGFDTDGMVAGTAFADDDVLAYDPADATWSLFYAPRARSAAIAAAHVDALAVARDLSDRIFANGFQ